MHFTLIYALITFFLFNSKVGLTSINIKFWTITFKGGHSFLAVRIFNR